MRKAIVAFPETQGGSDFLVLFVKGFSFLAGSCRISSVAWLTELEVLSMGERGDRGWMLSAEVDGLAIISGDDSFALTGVSALFGAV